MTQYSPIYKLALGALWTAGHHPDTTEKSELRRACGCSIDFDEFWKTAGTTAAIKALESCGYEINPAYAGERGSLDLIKPLPIEHATVPMASHVIRLTGRGWFTLKDGDHLALQGDMTACRRGFTIANAKGSWHRSGNWISMGCGGPSSFSELDCRLLQPTSETYRLLAWQWIGSPQADGGAHFRMTVPIWEWTPSTDAADFLSPEDAEHPL